MIKNIFRANSLEKEIDSKKNPKMTNFILWKMKRHRDFLVNQRPVIYHIYDIDGYSKRGFFHEMYFEKYLGDEEYQIRIGDVDKEIQEANDGIKNLEAKLRELYND